MRIPTVAAVAALAAALLMPAVADAQSGKRRSAAEVARSVPVRAETAETIRANAADPSGNYRGYPDWARFAFGPVRPGGSGGR
jgi:hypothetical protein